jgi:putative ABC transport system permease protein
MKYLPLIMAGVWRKPVRTILTMLSVLIAFTLFGLTIGMNATFATVEANARMDRIYTGPRFGGPGLPLAVAQQIEKLPGVARVGIRGFVNGYHQDPKNRAFAMFVDPGLRQVMSDWPLSPRQWDLIQNNRTGVVISKIQALQWKLKAGDSFTITSPAIRRADGNAWILQVLDVADDMPYMTNGYMIGNFDYFDKSRPLAQQGTANQYIVATTDLTRTAAIAQQIDGHFANSAAPTQSITEKAAFDISNSGLDIAAVDRDIALAGMFMVLFLTANGIARSVRERFPEFAMLKTLGYSDTGVVALVFWEAALPCVTGALLGVGLAAAISALLPHFFPPGGGLPPLPTMTAIVFVWAALVAALVALASSALPALRLRQMDIATALSGR